MSLKVFQIAKKLGIDSKAIVQKCVDEGIPSPQEDKPWTHMSPVSAGLAATIEEWFASGDLKTKPAVETPQHVDVAKIKKAPRKRSHKKGAGAETEPPQESGQETATAVAEPPAESAVAETISLHTSPAPARRLSSRMGSDENPASGARTSGGSSQNASHETRDASAEGKSGSPSPFRRGGWGVRQVPDP